MPEITHDWKLTSARVAVHAKHTTSVLGLKSAASHEYYKGGGCDLWMTQHRIDPNSVDVAFGKIRYDQLLSGDIGNAIEYLTINRATVRRLQFWLEGLARFESVGLEVKRSLSGGYTVYVTLMHLDWANDKLSCELAIRAMRLMNSECNCFSPGTVDGIQCDFVFTRGVYDSINKELIKHQFLGETVYSEFVNPKLQTPCLLRFFFDNHTASQIVHLLERLCDLVGSKPDSIFVLDEPADKDRQNPLPPPEGAWNSGIWGSYKKGFDPFKRPKVIDGSVRYPIWRKSEPDKLYWQVDIVHTETESFFDVQSSEGPEYLQKFLDKNNLKGEIWQGDFSERWNFPIPKHVETPREDALQNKAFMDSLGPEFHMSSLDQTYIETAEAYVESLKERAEIELDYTPESLQVLDDYVIQYFPDGCMFDTTIQGVAAYVGEVIRRECGAEWMMSEKYPPGVAVNGFFANVRAWAEKRFDPNEKGSLVEKFERYTSELEARAGIPRS